MATGHRLNISIVLAAVYRLSGLFRAVSAVEPSLCRHFPSLRRPNPTTSEQCPRGAVGTSNIPKSECEHWPQNN